MASLPEPIASDAQTDRSQQPTFYWDVELPALFDENWTLSRHRLRDAFEQGQLEGCTVSSLCINQLEWQVAEHHRMLQEQRHVLREYRAAGVMGRRRGVVPLTTIAIAKVINLLEESNDIVADVKVIAKSLNSARIAEIARDSRTPYLAIRAFLALPPNYGPGDAAETVRAGCDLDESVLVNERYLRSKLLETGDDHQVLLRLDQVELFFDPSRTEILENRLIVTRQDPPKGGLELFDVHRPRRFGIQRKTQTFISTFHRLTRNILHGLDWDHVLVAGGMALTTLMHVDSSKDNDVNVRECDVDVYIYGLTPDAANRKVREIYRVWSRNLPPDNKQRLVVKNAKTITFLPSYPNRRLQIILRLVKSPTSVLLNFDLDPCAIGFNGTEVLMLPRCARALETGYSVFTMDLIWGHHLGDRRASQDLRIFKYADRGFGIRILPAYARTIELPSDEKGLSSSIVGKPRRPAGLEPGLKTLKRILYMAADMVKRFYYGPTDLVVGDSDDDEFLPTLQELRETEAYRQMQNEELRAQGKPVLVPRIHLNHLDSRDLHRDFPKRRQGLANFEVWMRHHEAWRLDAVGEAELVLTSLASDCYDAESYDDLPRYKWVEGFDVKNFADDIDHHNNMLLRRMNDARDSLLKNSQMTLSAGESDDTQVTGKVHRIVHGPDIDKVYETLITIPLMIPITLEKDFEQMFEAALQDSRVDVDHSQTNLLIPVHPGDVQTFQDNFDEMGDIRFWLLGNEIMWAGIDRRIDEIFEILWHLMHWMNNKAYKPIPLNNCTAVYSLARRFYDRLPLVLKVPGPMVSDGHMIFIGDDGDVEAEYEAMSQYAKSSVVPLDMPGVTSLTDRLEQIYNPVPEREACLFHVWALDHPPLISRSFNEPFINIYSEDNFLYPPPEESFWKDGDEGSSPSRTDQWINHPSKY